MGMGAAVIWESLRWPRRVPPAQETRRPGRRARDDRQRRGLHEADHFGRAALESLDGVLAQLRTATGRRSCSPGKPFVFAAGADIDPVPERDTRDRARREPRRARALRRGSSALPFPTLAAINGACLGGGVEIALHCDASHVLDRVRHFACPEVFLGIFPAWGGTQLVPRLVGAETRREVHRREPAAPEPHARRAQRPSSSASPTRCSSRPSSWTSRSPSLVELAAGDESRDGARHRDEASDGGDPQSALAARRPGARRRAGALPRARPDRGRALRLVRSRRATAPRRRPSPTCCRAPRRRPRSTRSTSSSGARRARRAAAGRPAPARASIGLVGAGLMAAQLATLFLRRLEVPIAHPRRQRGDRSQPPARASTPTSPSRSRRAATTRARRASSPRWSRPPRRTTTSPTATSCSRPSSRSST